MKVREIINPWTDLSGYNCFGCSPNNPLGAHMRFYEEGPNDRFGDIICVWQPTQNHQSWINTLHGGMQATLLDEVCGWVVFKKLNTSGVTAKMEIRYKHPISTISGPLLLKARLKSDSHRVAMVEGEIWAKQSPEEPERKICATAECTYFYFQDEKAREMGFREATLADAETSLEQLVSPQ